jgi:hypothetical protein
MSHEELFAYIKQHIDVEGETLGELLVQGEKVLAMETPSDSHAHQICATASELNGIWMDDALEQALDEKAIEKIRGAFRKKWLTFFSDQIEVAHSIANGFRTSLPGRIDDKLIDKWDTLRDVSPAEFSVAVQGVLNAEWIKSSLCFICTSEDRDKADQLKEWIDEWIDEKANNMETLQNFVEALTGAPSVTLPFEFKLDHHLQAAIYPHTCFYNAQINPNVTKEILWDTLDRFGSGKEATFTRN